MTKYYKLTTFLFILCLCFAVTGCFGDNTTTKKYSTSKKEGIKTSCKSNLRNIGIACENYAADHSGYYPNDLYEITKNGYMKELPNCPSDNCKYKFVSKSRNEEPGDYDYYIIKCQNHPMFFDSVIGLVDSETEKEYINSVEKIKKHYNSVKNGNVYEEMNGTIYEVTKLTDDELKELGFK